MKVAPNPGPGWKSVGSDASTAHRLKPVPLAPVAQDLSCADICDTSSPAASRDPIDLPALRATPTDSNGSVSSRNPSGRASHFAKVALRLLLLSLLVGFPASSRAQAARAQIPSLSSVERLYSEGRFGEIVAAVPASPANPPDLDLYRGLALARLERWREAEAAFQAGGAKQPGNERFLLELAGVAYKLKDFSAAERNLRQALRLAPNDSYARNFLATLYFLDGNLDAALANWNRIGQPRITTIHLTPQPQLSDTLIERAFAFSPLETFRLDDLRTTEARLDNLGVFARYRFELDPADTSGYELQFHSLERNGWGAGIFDGLLSLFRGLPYLTIYPEFYNLNHSAMNLTSLLRWDDNKRRVFADFTTPLDENPRWRLGIHIDARDENWDLSNTLRGAAAPLTNLNTETIELGPELRSVENGRWGWQAGVDYAYRRFRNVGAVSPPDARFFINGASLEYRASADRRIIDDPERRLTVDSAFTGEFGKNFARGLGAFGATTGSLALDWSPERRGDDYETTLRFRAGRAYGFATLDQLYQLGVERDNNLWLRGIAGARDGRKGSAPLGREYVLWNWETDKIIYENGFVRVKLGPFLDTGRIADPSGVFGSAGWLWDPGVACTVRVLGSVAVVLSYGRDVGSGKGAFYATSSR
jgi:hypothetical protein